MKLKRKRYLVDRPLQLQIAKRLAMYWFAALLFVILPLAFYRTFDSGGLFASNVLEICKDYSPVFLMLFVFLPFAVSDSIRLSNRFAGPIYRLCTDLKRRESGEEIGSISFRDGDYFSDLPSLVNSLIRRVDELETASAATANKRS